MYTLKTHEGDIPRDLFPYIPSNKHLAFLKVNSEYKSFIKYCQSPIKNQKY